MVYPIKSHFTTTQQTSPEMKTSEDVVNLKANRKQKQEDKKKIEERENLQPYKAL